MPTQGYLCRIGLLLLSMLLFSASVEAAGEGYKPANIPQVNTFEEPVFTANKMHMYLGLGSLAAAALTGALAPGGDGVVATNQSATNTPHYYAANAAIALGGAAIVSGLILHWDDITLANGILDPDLMHMMLGVLGTAGYVYAASKAPRLIGGPSNGHAAAGIAGAAMMMTAIAYQW